MDFKSDRYNNNRPRRDFAGQSRFTAIQVVSIVFHEPVHQVLEKIKYESYFKWPNKMGETLWSTTRAFIVNTTKSEGTSQKIVELCGVI